MNLKKLIKKFLVKNLTCDKCGFDSNGNLFCDECQEYMESLEEKRKQEESAKEELRIRKWIDVRDKFLREKNGNRRS